MIDRIKAALNSTITWFLFLIGCVLFFWKKERDLENELEETKADGEIKDAKLEVVRADDAAADALGDYAKLRAEYYAAHPDEKPKS